MKIFAAIFSAILLSGMIVNANAADKLQHVVCFKFKSTATAQDIKQVEQAFQALKAAIAAPSIARKNQIANGMAAKMPPSIATEGRSLPAQPWLVKCDHAKPPDTTPMNINSSMMAS